MHARGDDVVDLFDGDLRLAQRGPPVLRNARLRHALGIACPAFGQEEPQPQHHWNLARRQGERNQRLTIGGLSE